MNPWIERPLVYTAAILLSCTHVSLVSAQAPRVNGHYLDQSVSEVIEHFRSQGYPFAYSTQLVPATLKVLREPASRDPVGIVEEILKPHGLELRQSDGIYLVIRAARGPPTTPTASLLVITRNQESRLLDVPVAISGSPGLPAVEDKGPGFQQINGLAAGRYVLEISAPGYLPVRRTVDLADYEMASLHVKLDTAPVELEALTVSASRYVLFSNSQFFVDQRAIQNLPGNGEDPVRSVHRLPGAAAGGWSAQAHFRGGEENESAIFLNGLRLLDPFHIRDFNNIFSAIDGRAISGVEAYTGGFPALYGNRMSGILLLQSQRPEQPRKHELGISVFNTSALTSGYNQSGELDWLVSARRSNLSLVLDKTEHGQPDYYDIFATLGINFSDDTRLTLNALHANDEILAITEHQVDDREQSVSDTKNSSFWLALEQHWPGSLGMTAVLSNSKQRHQRRALVNSVDQLIGFVDDDRAIDITGLRFDFTLDPGRSHFLMWGLEARRESARYRYRSEAQYDGFYRAYPGVPDFITRDINLRPSGESYAVYVSDRWKLTSRLTLDTGLRWDSQTYLALENNDQVSPRASLLYSVRPGLDVRISWGRYYQSQDIQEMQVQDGVDHFFPAQRADHLIAGLAYRFSPKWAMRAEIFDKRYSELRPRFENLLDPVHLIGELEPDRTLLSPDRGNAHGFEFTLDYDDGESFSWWASYTLSKATDEIDGRDELRNWDQRHAFQAGLAWQRGHWEFGLAAKYHTGWPTTSANLDQDEDGDFSLVFNARNQERLRSFVNIDTRIARIWQKKDSRITAFFELSNALDRKNQCCVDFDVEDEENPVLERSVKHWLGIAPAIGVLWEF